MAQTRSEAGESRGRESPATSRDPPAAGGLPGRDAELRAVSAALDRLGAPRPTWVTVSGEPGIGKSRVLAELVAEAERRRHLVFLGRGAEFERDLPFGVWVDALDDHIGELDRRELEELVGDRLPELARVLPGAGAPGVALPSALQHERFHAHRAVRALLQRLASRRPVVVVLDDVHWADAASLELIAHLLRRPLKAPVLVALGFRPRQVDAGLRAELAATLRDGSLVEISLAALSPEDADSLLDPAMSAVRRAALYRQSGGNPFYLRELARAPQAGLVAPLRENGDADGDGDAVPAVVSATLRQELAALSDEARRLAWGAAVAGDPSDLDIAGIAADMDEDGALAVIDELLRADVVHRTAMPRRYAFRHPIVRRSVYDAAGEAWRLRAHARVADALADRPEALSTRAHHVERCAHVGDEAAIALLERAGHHVAVAAPAVAAQRFTAALRLLPEPPAGDPMRRLGLLAPLAGALASCGDLEPALTCLQEALRLVPPTLPELEIRLIAACAACENLLGRHRSAHARLLRALDALPAGSHAAAAALYVELSADALYDSDFDAMRSWAERGLELARPLEDRTLVAITGALLCFAEYGLGRTDRAEEARRESAACLDALRDDELAGRLDAPYYLGFGEYFCERYDDAIRHLERGIAVSRATGQAQFLVPMMVGLAHALETRGRLAEAREMAEGAVEAARLSGHRQLTGFALVSEALACASLGDWDDARTAADRAVDTIPGLDESVLTLATHAHTAVMWVDIGEIDRGLEAFRAAGAPDFPRIERGRRGWLYTVLARVELKRGDLAAARAWLERAEATVDGLGLPLADAWVLYVRAAILLAAGDADTAAGFAVEAAERAESVGAVVPAGRARTLAGAAMNAAGRREEAIEQLAEAEAALGACGAVRYRDEAARELRRLGQRAHNRQRRGAGGSGLDALSGREREIADRVADGQTNRAIAGEMFLSEKTVEGHLTNVFAKLGISSRVALAEVVGRSRSTPG